MIRVEGTLASKLMAESVHFVVIDAICFRGARWRQELLFRGAEEPNRQLYAVFGLRKGEKQRWRRQRRLCWFGFKQGKGSNYGNESWR